MSSEKWWSGAQIIKRREVFEKSVEMLATYLPIGGGAEGRGGSTSCKMDDVGLL